MGPILGYTEQNQKKEKSMLSVELPSTRLTNEALKERMSTIINSPNIHRKKELFRLEKEYLIRGSNEDQM